MKEKFNNFILAVFFTFFSFVPSKTWGMESSYEIAEKVYDSTTNYSAGVFDYNQKGNILSTIPKTSQKAYEQRAFVYEKQPQVLKQENEKILRKVVIGQDGRTRITQTTQWPYTICVQMSMLFDGQEYGGTGSMVGPHHVLTCGHNVYTENKWADRILVYPALNDNNSPFGEIKVVKAMTFTSWILGDQKFDMALLVLNKSIGEYTGWAGLLSLDNVALAQEEVNITGYPGDKGLKQMWTMCHKIKTIKPEQFDYEIDTYGGQSGSPVWIDKWGMPMVLGVHTLGSSSVNSGVRLSTEKFVNFLQKIISQTYILNVEEPSIYKAKSQTCYEIRKDWIPIGLSLIEKLKSYSLTFGEFSKILDAMEGYFIKNIKERRKDLLLMEENVDALKEIIQYLESPEYLSSRILVNKGIGIISLAIPVFKWSTTDKAKMCGAEPENTDKLVLIIKTMLKKDIKESMKIYNLLHGVQHPKWNKMLKM